MKKEYNAMVKHLGYKPDTWFNAGRMGKYNQQYFNTLEEARQAIEDAKALFPDKPHHEVHKAGMLSVGSYTDAETAHRLSISETRIRVREVTEWEEVE